MDAKMRSLKKFIGSPRLFEFNGDYVVEKRPGRKGEYGTTVFNVKSYSDFVNIKWTTPERNTCSVEGLNNLSQFFADLAEAKKKLDENGC